MSASSGIIYGVRLLQVLQEIDDVETHLVMSATGKMYVPIETDYAVKDVEGMADVVHKYQDMAANISSGSYKTSGMIAAPCSMKTLSCIVNSYSDNLLTRAADVVLKEGRRLVLMPRETPLHTGHCKLLYEDSHMGDFIAPPVPAFYNLPTSLEDIINHSVGRVLDLFDINTSIVKRWSGSKTE